MNSDDLRRKLVGPQKWRRRKRSVIGKDWVAPTLQDTAAGEWCPRCKIRHPYNGKARLLSRYERRKNVFVILWLCPITFNVVGELCLSSSGASDSTSSSESPGPSGSADG